MDYEDELKIPVSNDLGWGQFDNKGISVDRSTGPWNFTENSLDFGEDDINIG